jgi:hypothetical protein
MVARLVARLKVVPFPVCHIAASLRGKSNLKTQYLQFRDYFAALATFTPCELAA